MKLVNDNLEMIHYFVVKLKNLIFSIEIKRPTISKTNKFVNNKLENIIF